MGTVSLPPLSKACPFFVPVVWSSKSLRTLEFRGTQVVYWIDPVKLFIKSLFYFRYLYLLAFCWPDTDGENVSGRVHIPIVKNATIRPDNKYFAGYPCIRSVFAFCQIITSECD